MIGSKKKRPPWSTVFSVIWKTQRNVIFTVVGILVGVLALLGGPYLYKGYNSENRLPRGQLEEPLEDIGQEERVYLIASRFRCVACGVCRDMPLETCTCNFGVMSRDLIRHEIVAQASDESIIYQVNEQFGGLEGKPSTYADSGRESE